MGAFRAFFKSSELDVDKRCLRGRDTWTGDPMRTVHSLSSMIFGLTKLGWMSFANLLFILVIYAPTVECGLLICVE